MASLGEEVETLQAFDLVPAPSMPFDQYADITSLGVHVAAHIDYPIESPRVSRAADSYRHTP